MNKKYILFKSIILIIILSFPFLGSDCNNTTNPVTNDNIVGNWLLTSNTGGTQHDICPGENINFQSGGVAILTCPNQVPINRNYSVTSSTLKFTDTGVEYQVNLTNSNYTMNMTGQGSVSGRILVYSRLTTAVKPSDNNKNSNIDKNSSEK